MFIDFNEPSLTSAIALLRDRTQWPPDFGPWGFAQACTCAMGLFNKKWGTQRYVLDADSTADLIGINHSAATKIFINSEKPYDTITPEDIADKLEALV